MIANYDVLLTDFAVSVQGQRFRWGATDCGSIVRRALKVCHGKDILKGAGLWNSLKAIRKFVKGGGGPVEILMGKGFTEVAPGFARCADVVVVPGEDADDMPQTGILLHRDKVLSSDRLHGVFVSDFRTMEVAKDAVFLRGPE